MPSPAEATLLVHDDRGPHLVSGHIAEERIRTRLFRNKRDLRPARRRNDDPLEAFGAELGGTIAADIQVHPDEQTDRDEGMQLGVLVLEHQLGFPSGVEGYRGGDELASADLHDDLLVLLTAGRREGRHRLAGHHPRYRPQAQDSRESGRAQEDRGC